jgi:hypothetical protein
LRRLCVLAGLVAMAAGACQADPAPPTPPTLAQAASIAAAADRPYGVFGSALIVAVTDAPATVRAHRMPDGDPLWTAELPDAAGPVTVRAAAAGLVLVNAGSTALALDARTGAARWRARGVVLGFTGDDANVVTMHDTDQGIALAGRRPATGAPRWTDTVGPAEEYTVGYGAGRVATVAVVRRSDGAARLRDAASGEARRGRVGRPGPGSRLALVDDLLLVSTVDDSVGTTTAYDSRTLRRRWTVDGAFERAAGCGVVICLGGNGIRALDPGTGADRWARPDVPFAGPALAGTKSSPLLSVADPDVAPVVLDPRTGATMLNLAPWTVLGPDGRRLLLLQHTDGTTDRVGLADLDGSTVRELGRVPPVVRACAERDTTAPGCPRPPGQPSGCRPGRGWFVCAHVDGQLRVWRHAA